MGTAGQNVTRRQQAGTGAQSVMYLGLDPAWSAINLTGACALGTAGRIVDERMLGSDDETIGWIADLVDGFAVVAIDAPLHVPTRGAETVQKRAAVNTDHAR